MMRVNHPYFWLYHLCLLLVLIGTIVSGGSFSPAPEPLDGLAVTYALQSPPPLFLAQKKRKRKRVALYLRVSTDKQAEEGRSLESQLADMKRYCRRKGWEIVATYQDEGLSGRLADRPALQNMLADARAGQFDVIMVYYISRFYRKLESLLSTMKLLRDLDVSFVSLNEDIDFTTKWGKLILSVLGILAEIYVDELSESTSRGKRQRAEEGLYNGSIPTGYCNGLCMRCTDPNGPNYCPLVGRPPIGDGQILVPHPIENQAVRLAFEWYATGHLSDADIAYKLNHYPLEYEEQQYTLRPKPRRTPDPDDPPRFTHDIVRDLLRRLFYTGQVEYKGGEGVAEERKKFKKAQAVYEGQHPALITSALYDRVQTMRRRRQYNSSHSNQAGKRVYPLSRLLFSWPLRSRMRAVANGSGVRQYRDTANIGRSRLDPGSRSPQPTVKAKPVENQVLAVLNTLHLPDDWQQRILAYLVSAEGGPAQIERQRRQVYTRFERLKELYLAGDYAFEQFEQEKQQLERELARLLTPSDLDNAAIRTLLSHPAQLWQQATPQELKEIFKAIFQQVYIQGTKVVRLVAHPIFMPHLSDPQRRVFAPGDDDDPTLKLSL